MGGRCYECDLAQPVSSTAPPPVDIQTSSLLCQYRNRKVTISSDIDTAGRLVPAEQVWRLHTTPRQTVIKDTVVTLTTVINHRKQGAHPGVGDKKLTSIGDAFQLCPTTESSKTLARFAATVVVVPCFEGRHPLAHFARDVDLIGRYGQQVLVQNNKEGIELLVWVP